MLETGVDARFGTVSLQLRKKNAKGNCTLRYVWDVISREDSRDVALVETWGGNSKGYIQHFDSAILLERYLLCRLKKATASTPSEDMELKIIGQAQFAVKGCGSLLGEALESPNHEVALMRMNIKSTTGDGWNENVCLAAHLSLPVSIVEPISSDEFSQAMCRRIKQTFVSSENQGGTWVENMIAVASFMMPTNDMGDVLGGEKEVFPLYDSEFFKSVLVKVDVMEVGAVTLPENATKYKEKIVEPVEEALNRGENWGEWS